MCEWLEIIYLKTQLTPSQHDSLLQLNMKMSMLGFNFLWSMFSRVISWLIATYESVNLRQSMVACWWNMGYKTESFSGATCSIPLISHPCQRHSKGYASYFSYRQTLGWNEEKQKRASEMFDRFSVPWNTLQKNALQ